MDYLAMIEEALAAADEASQTADNREGESREMWLATAATFMDASRTFALASIAESFARIADNSDTLAAWVNHTGPEPDMEPPSLDSPGAHALTVGGNFAY